MEGIKSTTILYEDFQSKEINRFLIGMLIYTVVTNLFFNFLPGTICNIFQMAGLLICSFYWIKLFSKYNISDQYLKISISLLLIWQIYILTKGLVLNYLYIKEYLFVRDRFLQYFVPLVVFIPVITPYFLQKIFYYSYKLGIVFLVTLPFLLLYILSEQSFSEQYVWTFVPGCGFILLTSFYHDKRKVVVSAIVTILAFIIITIMARRNIMLTCAGYLFSSFWIFIFFNKQISLIKKIGYTLLSVILLLAGYGIFVSNQSGAFSKITNRISDDSREGVLIAYFMDMSDTDLLIGKGINGTYYCPGVDYAWTGIELKHRDVDDRVYIECGYLQLMLNGGIIYVILYLLVLVPAVIKGFFFSRNIFSKASATFILLWLIDMVPFGLPTFTFRYFLVWFCVAICYSKEIRLKDENEMMDFLQYKNGDI